MIKISITGMTIEIPDEVGALHGLLGSATKVTGAVNTPIQVAQDLLGQDEPETVYEAEGTGKDELEEKRKAEEAAKRSEASKKAAATKKANEEKAAAVAKAAAQKAALEDDAPGAGAITQADVKARFTELIDKDIDIIPILSHFGAAKISLLDAARYGEVMDYVKEM